MKKTLLPNDFRDFLSILSFIGFIAIFLKYAFEIKFLSNYLDAIFLLIAGTGLLVVGKVFTINKWLRDGIQRNETIQILSGVVGLSSFIIGIILLLGIEINTRFLGYVGIVALFPAIFILTDYISKNI